MVLIVIFIFFAATIAIARLGLFFLFPLGFYLAAVPFLLHRYIVKKKFYQIPDAEKYCQTFEITQPDGLELFELVPTTPYTDDDLNWRDENSRVQKEHNDTSLQNIELISTSVPDWESYDTVLFGYPLWWREAAWHVNNFVKSNNFSGKTVIPFCTSTSDGIGDSGSKLAQMAGTGTWQEGMRFPENDDESSIRDWAKSLNLK